MPAGASYRLISHRPGALGLRLGLGPGLRHRQSLQQLQALFDEHSFWARGRSQEQLALILRQSAACISVWQGPQLIGFGRASSDSLFRAVLWDVVVNRHNQGEGLGRRVVEALLEHPSLARVERVYLMTSNCTGFYERLGFAQVDKQQLLLRERIN